MKHCCILWFRGLYLQHNCYYEMGFSLKVVFGAEVLGCLLVLHMNINSCMAQENTRGLQDTVAKFQDATTKFQDTTLRRSYYIREVRIRTPLNQQNQDTSLPTEIITQEFIQRYSGGSLMHTLSRLPGVGLIGIGSAQSKPLIRGLGFNRVSVVEKGIKHEGQQWGLDHGLEIDQFATGAIEVIRGGNSFLYGSDAMGGVIRIHEEPWRQANGLSGSLQLLAGSNNNLFGGSGMLKGRTKDWIYGGRFTRQSYADYRVPADTVYVYSYAVPLDKKKVRNTAGRERNLHGYGGYVGDPFQSVFYISQVIQRSGFFANAHGLEPRRVDYELHDASSRDLQWPSQKVKHLKIINKSAWQADRHRMELETGFQHNFREEYSPYVNHGYMPPIYPDTMRTPPTLERQYDKRVYSLNFRDYFSLGKHTFTVGFSGEHQENVIGGWSFLTPAFRQSSTGLFLYDRYHLTENTLLHIAARTDHSSIHIEEYRDWFPSGIFHGSGMVAPQTEYLLRAADLSRAFTSFVWSAGINQRWDRTDLSVNVGKSFRVPIAKELGANGVNYHYFSYEKGNPDLSPEQSYQLDLGIGWSGTDLKVNLSPYYNYFTNYIYLNPTSRYDHQYGAGNQVFEYTQAQVARYGAELNLNYRFSSQWNADLLGEYLRAEQLSGDKKGFSLPFSPPASLLMALHWTSGDDGRSARNGIWLDRPYASVDLKLCAAQNRIVPPEKKTGAYGVVNIQAGAILQMGGTTIHVGIQARNILDTKYMEHTSFYRLIEMPEQGRNIMLSLSVPLDWTKGAKKTG